MRRGTFIIDLDGTILRHGTDELLPGAREFLDLLEELEYGAVFVTRRGDEEWGPDDPRYSEAATRAAFRKHGLDESKLILNARSPRFLVDDSPIDLLPRETDEGFTPEILAKLREALSRQELD